LKADVEKFSMSFDMLWFDVNNLKYAQKKFADQVVLRPIWQYKFERGMDAWWGMVLSVVICLPLEFLNC
jgi:hypothetical protein